MMYGDFYYEDSETGKVVSRSYYNSLYKQKREDEWPYREEVERYENEKDYAEQTREAEREALTNSLFDQNLYRYGEGKQD